MPLVRGQVVSRIGRETLFSLLSAGVYAAGQWLLLKMIYSYAGTSTAGWYSYAMAIIAPIMALGSMGLRGILATDAKNEYALSEYFSVRIITVILCLLGALSIYLVIAPREAPVGLAAAFLGLVVYRSGEWLSDITQGEYQRQGRMLVVLGTFGLKLICGIGCFSVVLAMTHRIALAFVPLAVVSFSVLLGYELRPRRLRIKIRLKWPDGRLIGIVRMAAPAGVTLLLASLQSSIPRYLIEKDLTLKALGIFAALSYFGVLGGFVSTATSNAVLPILGEYWYANNWGKFRRLMLAMLAGDVVFNCCLLVAFSVVGHYVLRLMFNRDVAEHARLLPLVVGITLAVFLDSHLGCAVTVLRRFKEAMLIQIVRIGIVTPIAVWMIFRWGITGALEASIVFPVSSLGPYAWIVVRDLRRAELRSEMVAGAAEPSSVQGAGPVN